MTRKRLPLRDLVLATRDGEWGRSDAAPDHKQMMVVRGTDFSDARFGAIAEIPIRFVPSAIAERKQLEPWDILIETAGGSPTRPTGRTLLVTPRLLASSRLPVTCASFARFIRIDPKLAEPAYVYWYLQDLYQRGLMAQHQVQHTGVARFQFTRFAETELIGLPARGVQRAIARILGALDDKIELNRHTNETLEAMARALFQAWFVDFDPVRAKMDGRQPEGMDAETAKLFPSKLVESAIGPVPAGWNVTRIGDLFELQRGTTYKSALIGDDGPVLLGLATIKRDGGFRSDSLRRYSGESPEKLLLRPGDIYASLKDVTQSGDLLGSVARVPPFVELGRLTQDTVKLNFHSAEGTDEFVYWTLRSPEFRTHSRAHAMGTTNLSLSREDFLGYAVAKPPGEHLARLMRMISSLSRRFEDDTESRTLVTVRDTLLPKLLSGELRVPDAEKAVSAVL